MVVDVVVVVGGGGMGDVVVDTYIIEVLCRFHYKWCLLIFVILHPALSKEFSVRRVWVGHGEEGRHLTVNSVYSTSSPVTNPV